MEVEQVDRLIREGKSKLLRARQARDEPFVDKTLYTSLNGMLITSYLKAYRIFRNDPIKDHALKSLRRILDLNFTGKELLHCDGTKALLDDYIYLTEAFIAAYEVTGNSEYLCTADSLMEQCLDRLWDRDEGGFFDTDTPMLGSQNQRDRGHPSSISQCSRNHTIA